MHREIEVRFDEVKAEFLRENNLELGSNGWALGALEVANRQLGNWTRVILTPQNVLSVMLPEHRDGVNLVPPAGSSVSEAIEKLKSVDRSSRCYKRIQEFSDARTSVIFLSAAPINDLKYPDYKGLIDRGYTGLTHLDGLHRLIAWGREKRPGIPAYVAGLT